MHLVLLRVSQRHAGIPWNSCYPTQLEVLTFLGCQRGPQAQDIPHHHIWELWEDGMLDRQWDVVCSATVLCIPHPEQGQPHIHSPDHKGVVGSSLGDLHKVISAQTEGRLNKGIISPTGEVSNSSDGWLLVFSNSHLMKSTKYGNYKNYLGSTEANSSQFATMLRKY